MVQNREPDRNISDLKKTLKNSVGRPVKITILDHGEEKTFDIVVPKDLVK